jgi:hypothetical protein
VQVRVTARDKYGNAVATGDAGFALVSPPGSAIKAGSYSRSVSGAVTTFTFSILSAAVYVLRVEMATGALVYQSKFRVKPGGISHLNSRYFAWPDTFVVGQTMLATLQVRSAR